MKVLKDKNVILLALVLLVFTVGYFIVANKVSYAFVNDYDADFYHEKTMDIIKEGAIAYANNIKDEFTKDDNIKYVTVQELINDSYLIPDSEGNIGDPSKNNEPLNSKNIMIKLENDEFQIKII